MSSSDVVIASWSWFPSVSKISRRLRSQSRYGCSQQSIFVLPRIKLPSQASAARPEQTEQTLSLAATTRPAGRSEGCGPRCDGGRRLLSRRTPKRNPNTTAQKSSPNAADLHQTGQRPSILSRSDANGSMLIEDNAAHQPQNRRQGQTSTFRAPRRITITVSWSLYEALVHRSNCEGRSLSNLAAFLLESACRTTPNEAGGPPEPGREQRLL